MLLAAVKPAGGAAIGQIVIATTFATVVTGALLWLCDGHRKGSNPLLGRWAAFAHRVSGLPGWAALPMGVSAASLHIALLGMYWDISLHIDQGRDPGPLANPAHYLILFGLFGIFAAGVLAITLPGADDTPGPAPLQILRGWKAPVGGVLMTACGGFALIGFPLDDLWHRMFGQDVTLWGPTHLMLIGGAGMSLIGMAVLLGEAMWSRRQEPRDEGVHRAASRILAFRRVGLMGGLLIGLSTFQGEFDFGVPQFRMVFHPMLIAWAGAFALVGGRLFIGRGGAIGAALFFLAIRGGISLIVGPVFGETTPAMALYVPEALLVELAALVVGRRLLPLALVSGVLVGTLGILAEDAWTHLVFRLPWTSNIFPEAFVVGVAAGIAGALMGALLGTGLRGELPRPSLARPMAAVGFVVLAACVTDGLILHTPTGVRAQMTTRPAGPGMADVRVRITPDVGRGSAWTTATAWQDGGLVVDRLKSLGGGVYATTEPIPVHGDWKALIRVHYGRALIGAPIYLPDDPAIPVKGVPAKAQMARPFERDKKILQREQKQGVPMWLSTLAPLVVLALYLAFAAALAWGVARTGRTEDREPPVSRSRRFVARPRAATPQPS
jgi:hypothetical protein